MNNSHLVTIDNEGKNDYIRGILSLLAGEFAYTLKRSK